MKEKFSVKSLALVGVMSALVFAASWIQITIPTMVDNTRLHLGNVLCLLSGLLLGPVQGGLAAGIGSMFFDLTNPLFIRYAPVTFLFKFIMAFICGSITWPSGQPTASTGRKFLGAGVGAFSYVVLYLSQHFVENYLLLRLELPTVLLTLGQKALLSSLNSTMAVLIVVPLSTAIAKGMQQRGTKM